MATIESILRIITRVLTATNNHNNSCMISATNCQIYASQAWQHNFVDLNQLNWNYSNAVEGNDNSFIQNN